MGTLTSFSMTAMPRTPSSPAPESASHVEASRETATERGPSGALADIPGPRPPAREGARGSIERMRKRPSTLPATRSSPGGTRALPTGAALAETPAIAPGNGAAASSSQAASSSAAGSLHLAVLTRLADEFRMASEREVDPDRAAALINELRRHGTRAHADAGVVPAGLGLQEAAIVGLGQALGIGVDIALTLSLAKRVREFLFGAPLLLLSHRLYRQAASTAAAGQNG